MALIATEIFKDVHANVVAEIASHGEAAMAESLRRELMCTEVATVSHNGSWRFGFNIV